MIDIPVLVHYVAAGVALAMAGMSAATAIGLGSSGMLLGKVRQIWADSQTSQTMFFGTLLIEGSFIIAFLSALMTLFFPPSEFTWAVALAELGGAIAIGLACSSVALAIGKSVRMATQSVARQPLHARKIQMFMLIIMTLIETPAFFAFIVWMFIRMQIVPGLEIVDGMKLCAAGITMGVGSLGPALGQCLFAPRACTAVGLTREAYGNILTLSMLTEALIETPVLFSFVVSMVMILATADPLLSVGAAAVFFVAAFAISIGAFAASASVGYVGGRAVMQTALRPSESKTLFSLALICQAMIETSGLFALIISLFILKKITI